MLVFADSFDHLAIGHVDVERKWGKLYSGGVVSGGRRGTNGFRGTVQRTVGAQPSIIVGAALFFGGNGHSVVGYNPVLPESDPQGGEIFHFLCDEWPYLVLGVFSDGALRVSRGSYPYVSHDDDVLGSNGSSGSTALATSAPNVIPAAAWSYVEMEVVFDYTGAGSFKVWANDDLVFEEEDIQTIPPNPADRGTSNPAGGRTVNPQHITQVRMTSGGSNTGILDDVYIFNHVGVTNIARLGDVQVDYIKPDGPGAVSESEIVGAGATRWENVDETVPDSGDTAVRFNAVGDEDSYTHTDLPYDVATIYGVQVTASARKSDSGYTRAKLTNRVNGEVVESALLTPSAGDDYGMISAQFDESADGAWDLDKVQASEFGLKRAT